MLDVDRWCFIPPVDGNMGYQESSFLLGSVGEVAQEVYLIIRFQEARF